MAKLFSVKLANLENEMKDLKLNTSSTTSTTKIQELENKITELDSKINQMVNELTEILNQHATAIKDLSNIITGKK